MDFENWSKQVKSNLTWYKNSIANVFICFDATAALLSQPNYLLKTDLQKEPLIKMFKLLYRLSTTIPWLYKKLKTSCPGHHWKDRIYNFHLTFKMRSTLFITFNALSSFIFETLLVDFYLILEISSQKFTWEQSVLQNNTKNHNKRMMFVLG